MHTTSTVHSAECTVCTYSLEVYGLYILQYSTVKCSLHVCPSFTVTLPEVEPEGHEMVDAEKAHH